MVKKQNLPTRVCNVFQAFLLVSWYYLLVSWYYLLVSWYYAVNTLLTFHLQKTNPNNACTLWIHGSKKICWEPREGCDSRMKMMEYSPPRLQLIMDYACSQYNRRGITVDCR